MAQTQHNSALGALSVNLLLAASLISFISCSKSASEAQADTAKNADATSESAAPSTTATQSNFDADAYSGPTFTLPTSDGSTMTFTDLLGRGKPLVVNFWGTWCPPCRREMPEFVKIYKEYQPKGVQIVGVALRDTPEKVMAYTSQNGITWPMVLGDIKTAQDYGGIRAVPTTIIYDSQGKELSRYVGPMTYDMFKERLDVALEHEKEIASL